MLNRSHKLIEQSSEWYNRTCKASVFEQSVGQSIVYLFIKPLQILGKSRFYENQIEFRILQWTKKLWVETQLWWITIFLKLSGNRNKEWVFIIEWLKAVESLHIAAATWKNGFCRDLMINVGKIAHALNFRTKQSILANTSIVKNNEDSNCSLAFSFLLKILRWILLVWTINSLSKKIYPGSDNDPNYNKFQKFQQEFENMLGSENPMTWKFILILLPANQVKRVRKTRNIPAKVILSERRRYEDSI